MHPLDYILIFVSTLANLWVAWFYFRWTEERIKTHERDHHGIAHEDDTNG